MNIWNECGSLREFQKAFLKHMETLDPKTLLPLRAEQGAQWDPIFWAKLVEELSGHIVKDLKVDIHCSPEVITMLSIVYERIWSCRTLASSTVRYFKIWQHGWKRQWPY
jgi:hypothetical protein